jgi:hypothetical protein
LEALVRPYNNIRNSRSKMESGTYMRTATRLSMVDAEVIDQPPGTATDGRRTYVERDMVVEGFNLIRSKLIHQPVCDQF